MKFGTILWQECVFFKRKFSSITIGSIIGPVLYMIAFGWGLGRGMEVEGMDYMSFVIAGVLAMNTMSSSFSTIANDINISRLYGKTFENFMIAPMNMRTYALARIVAGTFRGIYSAVLILLISIVFRADLRITPYFILLLLLNCLVFSALGFIIGIVIKSHGDMAKFNSFVITPMSFLCGTFFSLEMLPEAVRVVLNILPLTQTVTGLRQTEFTQASLINIVILIGYFIVFLFIGIRLCKRAE